MPKVKEPESKKAAKPKAKKTGTAVLDPEIMNPEFVEDFDVKTIEFWCGVVGEFTDEGRIVHPSGYPVPRQVIHLAGVEFPVYSERQVKNANHKFGKLVPEMGTLLSITERKMKQVLYCAQSKVVRGYGKGGRAAILSTELSPGVPNPNYRKMPGDQPIGNFVYMIPVDEAVKKYGGHWRNEIPDPLIPVDD